MFINISIGKTGCEEYLLIKIYDTLYKTLFTVRCFVVVSMAIINIKYYQKQVLCVFYFVVNEVKF